jgi:CBS-domain-containing membrane protein
VQSTTTVRHISPAPALRRTQRVRDAMNPLARSVDVGASVADLIRAVVDESHPMVAVVTSTGRLVGTVSERDILQCLPPAASPGAAALAYARFLELRAIDVMAEAGMTVCEEDPLDLALDLLAVDRVPSLAVVDVDGCLCGVVTAASVAQNLCAMDAPCH